MKKILIIHYIDRYNVIDGNLPTIIDLYIFLKKLGINVWCILFSDDTDKSNINFSEILEKCFYNRYNENDYKIIKRIKYIKYKKVNDILKLNLVKYDISIMTDKTFFNTIRLSAILPTYNYFILNSWFSFYFKNEYPDNTTIFNENYLCGQVNYNKKTYKESLKNYIDNQNKMFILANGERRLTQDELYEIKEKYKNYKLVLCQDKIDNLDVSGFNLFDISMPLFDYSTYLYVPTKTYEFAPRMLLESIYLGKKIKYYKYPENKNKRFLDIINNNIDQYLLTENDEIIQIIIK